MPSRCITIILFASLVGCASPSGKFYDGKTLPPDKVAEVSLPIVDQAAMLFVPKYLDIEISKHKLFSIEPSNVGYFKPGDYEFKLTSLWWDRQNKFKNVVRGIAVTPCSLGVAIPFPFLPLAIACVPLNADKTCKSTWIMSLEAGKKYSIDVDWAIDPPQAKVKDEINQEAVFSTACEIQ